MTLPEDLARILRAAHTIAKADLDQAATDARPGTTGYRPQDAAYARLLGWLADAAEQVAAEDEQGPPQTPNRP